MEVVSLRPKLMSLRTTRFHGENRAASSGNEPWNIQLTQTIEVGLATMQTPAVSLQAVVKIDLIAHASKADAKDQKVEFSGSYEAKFDYPPEARGAKILPLFDQEEYQYVLVAQAFPLAMTHLRGEMQSMGFDARELPLGI